MRMDEEAVKIYEMKKNNLEGGEANMIKQVGEGKDIMSHMCKSRRIEICWEKQTFSFDSAREQGRIR